MTRERKLLPKKKMLFFSPSLSAASMAGVPSPRLLTGPLPSTTPLCSWVVEISWSSDSTDSDGREWKSSSSGSLLNEESPLLKLLPPLVVRPLLLPRLPRRPATPASALMASSGSLAAKPAAGPVDVAGSLALALALALAL
jgi:hypothetical protein